MRSGSVTPQMDITEAPHGSSEQTFFVLVAAELRAAFPAAQCNATGGRDGPTYGRLRAPCAGYGQEQELV